MIRKFGKYLAATALLGCLACLMWLSGLFGMFCQDAARRSLSARDLQTAAEWIGRAKSLNGPDAESEFLLARIHRKQTRIENFNKHLKRAESLGLDRERTRREQLLLNAQIGSLTDTLDELPRLLMDQHGDGAEVCEAFTNGLLINGMEDEATTLIAQWMQAYPDDPLPDVLLGRLAEFRLQMDDANEHYRAALRKSPRFPPARFGRARVLFELNRWSEALVEYQFCLNLPNPGPAQLGIARCLRSEGQPEKALDYLRLAAKQHVAEFLDALRLLGEPVENDTLATEFGTLEANFGHHDEAIPWLQRAVTHNPKHREPRQKLAQSLAALGEFEKAKPHFEFLNKQTEQLAEYDRLHDAIRANPNDLQARYELGLIAMEYHSEQAGLFWFHSVLSRDPNHAAARAAIERHRPAILMDDTDEVAKPAQRSSP